MKVIDYVNISKEINRCIDKALDELEKVSEASIAYNLSDETYKKQISTIFEALLDLRLPEDEESYEDDDL